MRIFQASSLNRPARTLRLLLAASAALGTLGVSARADEPAAVASAAVVAQRDSGHAQYEGIVEAVRQTTVAAQVSGAVVDLQVRAGDAVRPGQVLMRIDARAADQAALAAAAQARAGRAATEAATREFERQRSLFAQQF